MIKVMLKAMANNIRSHIRGVVIDSKNMRREWNKKYSEENEIDW